MSLLGKSKFLNMARFADIPPELSKDTIVIPVQSPVQSVYGCACQTEAMPSYLASTGQLGNSFHTSGSSLLMSATTTTEPRASCTLRWGG